MADTGGTGDAARAERLWASMSADDRPARPVLDRHRIVDAAVRIADAEGLAAVTMRRVAAELGSSPMALYRHVGGKEDLPELMLDAVLGEVELIEPTGDWRADLRLLSARRRAVLLEHTWLSGVFGAHPPVGPHATDFIECELACLSHLDIGNDAVRGIVGAVDVLVTGSVMREMAERETLRGTGLSRAGAVDATRPYQEKIAESGRYPHFTRIMLSDSAAYGHTDADEDAGFLGVLDCLLDGLESRLKP
jgi:AcrR family transcriptional regulator